MKYFSILFSIAAILAIGCRNQSTKNRDKKPDHWQSLVIVSDDYQIITISNNDDTSMVKSYDGGSIFQPHHKTKVDSIKAYFTMAEKDTLFRLSKDIITNVTPPAHYCTDFVGDLRLTIYYNDAVQQSINYYGICKWDSLSQQTIHLHQILKRRIKWWSKRDRD
jgi:hypothetical protein